MSVFASVGVVVACGAVARAQTESPERPLQLSLRPDAKEVVLYEPLRVTVALRNVGSAPVKMDAYGEFLQNMGFLRSYEGEEFEACGRGKEGHRSSLTFSSVALRPGSELVSREMLLLHGRQGGRDRAYSFVLGRPGRYRLKVGIYLRGTHLLSEPVPVFVKPVPPDHTDAATVMGDMRVAAWIQGRWSGSKGAHVTLNELMVKFPNSMYADHARYELGKYWAGGYWPASRYCGKKAYDLLAAVSPRIGALRVRALVGMIELVGKAHTLADPFGQVGPQEVASPEAVAKLWEELDAYGGLVKDLGQERHLRQARKAIEQAKWKAEFIQRAKQKRARKHPAGNKAESGSGR